MVHTSAVHHLVFISPALAAPILVPPALVAIAGGLTLPAFAFELGDWLAGMRFSFLARASLRSICTNTKVIAHAPPAQRTSTICKRYKPLRLSCSFA